MEKKIRSSLEGLTFDLTIRRNGKTRKVIDNAINILYEDGVVKIEDHPRDGFGSSSDNQKKYLAQRIFSRLSIEDSAFKLNNTRWIDYYNKGYFSLTPFPKGEYDVNEWVNSNILNNG